MGKQALRSCGAAKDALELAPTSRALFKVGGAARPFEIGMIAVLTRGEDTASSCTIFTT